MTRKLIAMVMAAAMFLSVVAFAQAEAPVVYQTKPPVVQPAEMVQSALERGATLKMDLDVMLNNDVTMSLLGAAMGATDESSQSMLTAILDTINKLKTSVVYNKSAVSARIGTDAGEVITLQGTLNPKTMENSFAINLLPDTTVTLDQAMLQQVMAGMQQGSVAQNFTNAEAQAMVAPYLEAIGTFFTEQVLPGAQMEQGSYAVEGVATFGALATVPVTSHVVAEFLNQVLTVFKADTKSQEMLAEYMQAMAATDVSSGSSDEIPTVTDLINQIEAAVVNMKATADFHIATVKYYSSPSDTTAPVYLEIETSESGDQPMFATVVVKSDEKATDIAVAVLVKAESDYAGTSQEEIVSLSTKAPEGSADTSATDETPAAAEGTDWAALHNAVLNGEDQTATLVNVKITAQTTDTVVNSIFAMDMRTPMPGMGQMYLGISMDAQSALGDKVDQSGTLTLSLLSPAPLVTVTFALTETDEQPAAVPAGTNSFVITEDTTDADAEQLTGVLMTQGLPKVLENLKVALPEEAGIITMMIQSMTAEPTQP
ncbi:MAG: hypothetical protein ACOX7B_12505 [Christensenellales bacterium]